jgi:hypothetical protein
MIFTQSNFIFINLIVQFAPSISNAKNFLFLPFSPLNDEFLMHFHDIKLTIVNTEHKC